MRKILAFIIILNVVLVNGQDAVFSQFYHNPLAANPALTGVFNGKNRVGTSIRNQWYSIVPDAALLTANVFYDSRMNIINKDYLGLGVMVSDDRPGTAQTGKTSGYLSLSYSKHLTMDKYRRTNQYLVFGTQLGYGITYLGNSGFLFGSQFDKNKEIVDPDLVSGEDLLMSKFYPDINMGLMWYFTGRTNSFYISGSISHINRPDISLVQTSVDRLKMKYSGLIGGEMAFDNELSVSPSLFFNMQGQIIQSVFGASIRYEYYKGDNNAFEIGLWARLTNSITGIDIPDIIFSTGIEIDKLEIGMSYDISISNLNRVNDYKGAFELSLIYIFGENPGRYSVKCPGF